MKKSKAKVSSKNNNKISHQMNITPLGSRVLIRPFTKEELTKKNSFGIILPDTGRKEKSEQGKVLAVGPGEYRDGKLVSVGVKVGDKVAFSKYGYEDINVDGEELYLIKEENILAILK
jgi:chaperonin GroES